MTQFACMLRVEDVGLQRECYSDSSASKELGMLRLIAKRPALAQTFPKVEVGYIYVWWYATAVAPEIDQKCVALHHCVTKGCTVLPSCPIYFVSVIDEFARRKARKVAISSWSPEPVNIISSSVFFTGEMFSCQLQICLKFVLQKKRWQWENERKIFCWWPTDPLMQSIEHSSLSTALVVICRG